MQKVWAKHCLGIFSLVLIIINSGFGQTTVQKVGDNWQLSVDRIPYYVKGVTFGYQNDVAQYSHHLEELSFLGVNTIRLWTTDDHTMGLLDVAHAQNIKVIVGIEMSLDPPRMEADDPFNYLEDEGGKEALYQKALKTVERYKDHPAVLAWVVGDEVYLNLESDAEKQTYSMLLERVCHSIKQLDPNHPIVSVEASTAGLEWWEKYVPSIDIYGLNGYGFEVSKLAEELNERNIEKPYLITEFGVTGEQEVQAEMNGVKLEPSDQAKYEAIALGYNYWIKTKSSCVGVCVFNYGNGDNFESAWYFSHHRGYKRPAYWAIREAYTNRKPENFIPEIIEFGLLNELINSGSWVTVDLEVKDLEEDNLQVSFFYNQRTGSRKRRSQLNQLNHRGSLRDGFEIQLPKEHGAIKVYVNVVDALENMGIASTSIEVQDEEAKNKKYLVAKAELPFYVYKDAEVLPYVPSAYMGNYKSIDVDISNKEHVYSGNSSIKVSYDGSDGWYGVAFVDPPNDWGQILGGYEIEGAKNFTFWARADQENVKAKIGFGLIEKDKPFPDTAKKSLEVKLGTTWKKFSIKVNKLDLSCIRSGLVLVASGAGFDQSIYLDDVVFE